jgi:hypothetical protein
VDDDAAVGVVVAVEHQGTEDVVRGAGGGRDARDDGLEELVDAYALLRRDLHGGGRVEAEIMLDLVKGARDVGGGEVDLIETGSISSCARGEVHIREGLRLDALSGVDEKQGPSHEAMARDTS